MFLKNNLSRRKFVSLTGTIAVAGAILPNFGFADILEERKIRIAIVGGGFGSGFYFHEDPGCIVEAVSDLRKDRRDKLMSVYKCSKSYHSLEELIKDPKVEAVFVATPAPDHVRHVITCLKAGKHVLCAVPAAMNLEDCDKLKDAVKKSGLIYMMAETSYYRQNIISARKFYQAVDFGSLISAAAEYNHSGLEDYFFENGKPTWRHGLPPMLYPTHCTSFLIGVTGDRLSSVSCLGWGDDSAIFKNNPYNNPFFNETAFFQTKNRLPFRVEVNWKGAYRNVERGEWRGSKMSFFSPTNDSAETTIVRIGDKEGKDDGGFKNKTNIVEIYKQPKWWETDMLPEAMRHNSAHGGSHSFLSHEFVDSMAKNRKPSVDVHEAITYTAPGIVAHHSALKNGEYLKIPNFDK